MIVYCDIDGTICTHEKDYRDARPLQDKIDIMNRMHDEGKMVVYWTARGVGTGLDWSELTKNQLDSWGVKYHKIKLDKPLFDLFIDDRAINASEMR
jgi:hypothetical protein